MMRNVALLSVLFSVACSSGAVHPKSDAGANDGGGDAPDGGYGGGGDGGSPDSGAVSADRGQPNVSRSLALSADGNSIWVVNPESDSIAEIDVAGRALTREILLAANPPAVDGTTHRYDPAVRPRAIALVDSLSKAYVAGQAANAVFVVDTQSGTVTATIPTPAEPTAVVASLDGSKVYAVCHEGNAVVQIDTAADAITATVAVNSHPWGASLRADGSLLYVSYLLLGPGITAIDTASFTVSTFTALPDQSQDSTLNKLLPSGQVRGEYTVVPRPNSGELWVPHMLLATAIAQPALDFESTAFTTITWLSPGGGSVDNRLLFRPTSLPNAAGAFTDSVSGPHDIAFTPDGQLALVTMAQSEDVMVFDASAGIEVGLVRPTLGSLLEGIVVDAAGTHAYVHGRSNNSLTVLDIVEGVTPAAASVTVDPANPAAGIATVVSDPMPAALRAGFQIFYSANSAKRATTQNFWMACANCHLEGQTDAVTWQFLQGPRDTPSNAGGPINTGFLMRQALKAQVQEYDQVIRLEQGGDYYLDGGTAQQQQDLSNLAGFVNYAIPFPQNPNVVDGGLTGEQDAGAQLFEMYCVSCHSGGFYTDSGEGNPTLDLTGDAGPVRLHNIQTCVLDAGAGVAGTDQAQTDTEGDLRAACVFDTPTLRGVFATAPYFHDGSAATLQDAVSRIPAAAGLSAIDQANLAAFISTL